MGFIEDCTHAIDLDKNGLSAMVDENIRRNRMSPARVAVKDADGNAVKGVTVTVEQTASDFRFGCNAFIADHLGSAEKNAAYDAAFGGIFNQAVMPFYWHDDEPEQGKTRFARGSEYIYRRPDAPTMFDFCKRTGCEPKGHNMVWQLDSAGLPTWFPRDNKPLAMKLIDRRIRQLAELFADKIPTWDVTNETINAVGIKAMPHNFDVYAWKLASQLFPLNHLILNDYHCFFEEFHREQSALMMQAERLMENGCHVDGIGMQYHLFNKKEVLADKSDRKINAEYMLDMMNCYAQTGAAMHVSEITVPSYEGNAESLENQRIITENLYKLWFSMPNVKSIVWWNLADGYSFVDPKNPGWDENYYGGGLLNHDLSHKPAYDALEQLITKDWRTNLSADTDEGGFAGFTGFHGNYKLTVRANGTETVKNVHLEQGKPNLFTVTL